MEESGEALLLQVAGHCFRVTASCQQKVLMKFFVFLVNIFSVPNNLGNASQSVTDK